MADQEIESRAESGSEPRSVSEGAFDYKNHFSLLEKLLNEAKQRQEEDRRIAEECSFSREEQESMFLNAVSLVEQDREDYKKHIPSGDYVSQWDDYIEEAEDKCDKAAQELLDVISDILSSEDEVIMGEPFLQYLKSYERWTASLGLRAAVREERELAAQASGLVHGGRAESGEDEQ